MAKASAPRTPPSSSPPVPSLRELRARAHALKPVVRIGQTGLTEGVQRELDRALSAHELVKIHAAVDDRSERARLLQSLCAQAGATPVQAIGKMLVAFRPRPQPEPEPAPARKSAAARSKSRTRTMRTAAGAAKASKARRPARRTR